MVVFCYLEPLCGVARRCHVVIRLYEDGFFENRKMPKEMQINGMAGNQIYKMTLFSSVSVLQFFFILLDVKSGGAAINFLFFKVAF